MKKQLDSKKVKFRRLPHGCELAMAFIEVFTSSGLMRSDKQFCSIILELYNYLTEKYYTLSGHYYITDETIVFFGDDESCMLDWSGCIAEILEKG